MKIKDRIKEPSTWAGLAALLLLFRPIVPAQYQPVFDTVVGAAGAIAIKLPERAGPVALDAK